MMQSCSFNWTRLDRKIKTLLFKRPQTLMDPAVVTSLQKHQIQQEKTDRKQSTASKSNNPLTLLTQEGFKCRIFQPLLFSKKQQHLTVHSPFQRFDGKLY